MALVPYVHSPGAAPAAARRYTGAAAKLLARPTSGGGLAPVADTAAGTSPLSGAGTAPVDYQKLLADDPLLGQALAGYNAQGVQNQAQLSAAQMRALIQYGQVPSMSLPGSPSVDPATQQLASQNTAAGTSTVAALRRAYNLQQQGSDASLAARGILRSGAYGQHAAENLQGYNQAGYQADQQLLDYLQGLYSGYLSQQQTLQGSSVQATNDALNRLLAQIQAGQISGAAAQPPPAAAPVEAPPGTPPGLTGTVQPDPFQWVRGKVGAA